MRKTAHARSEDYSPISLESWVLLAVLLFGMRSSIAVCMGVLFILSGCGLKTVDGSGNVVVEQREVSGFSAVSMSGFGELIIQQTGKESLSITADDNLLPLLTSKV